MSPCRGGRQGFESPLVLHKKDIGAVAQLAERQCGTLDVRGSTPLGSTKYDNKKRMGSQKIILRAL